MLDDLNRDVASSGGGWFKLNRIEHGTPQGDRGRRRDAREDLRGVRRAVRKTGKLPPGACVHAHHRPARPRGRRRQGDPQVQRQRGRHFAILDALKEAKATAEIGDTLAIKVVRTRRPRRRRPTTRLSGRRVPACRTGTSDAAAARVHARRRAGRPVLDVANILYCLGSLCFPAGTIINMVSARETG